MKLIDYGIQVEMTLNNRTHPVNYLVLSYCKYGELFDIISETGALSENEA